MTKPTIRPLLIGRRHWLQRLWRNRKQASNRVVLGSSNPIKLKCIIPTFALCATPCGNRVLCNVWKYYNKVYFDSAAFIRFLPLG